MYRVVDPEIVRCVCLGLSEVARRAEERRRRLPRRDNAFFRAEQVRRAERARKTFRRRDLAVLTPRHRVDPRYHPLVRGRVHTIRFVAAPPGERPPLSRDRATPHGAPMGTQPASVLASDLAGIWDGSHFVAVGPKDEGVAYHLVFGTFCGQRLIALVDRAWRVFLVPAPAPRVLYLGTLFSGELLALVGARGGVALSVFDCALACGVSTGEYAHLVRLQAAAVALEAAAAAISAEPASDIAASSASFDGAGAGGDPGGNSGAGGVGAGPVLFVAPPAQPRDEPDAGDDADLAWSAPPTDEVASSVDAPPTPPHVADDNSPSDPDEPDDASDPSLMDVRASAPMLAPMLHPSASTGASSVAKGDVAWITPESMAALSAAWSSATSQVMGTSASSAKTGPPDSGVDTKHSLRSALDPADEMAEDAHDSATRTRARVRSRMNSIEADGGGSRKAARRGASDSPGAPRETAETGAHPTQIPSSDAWPFAVRIKHFFRASDAPLLTARLLPALDHRVDGLAAPEVDSRKWWKVKRGCDHTIDLAGVAYPPSRLQLWCFDASGWALWTEQTYDAAGLADLCARLRVRGLRDLHESVLECRYDPARARWSVERLRHNKPMPNSLSTAVKTWRNIQENLPLTRVFPRHVAPNRRDLLAEFDAQPAGPHAWQPASHTARRVELPMPRPLYPIPTRDLAALSDK